MTRQLPKPPVIVAVRQNHPALLGRLEDLKIADTSFGEALGAGLFVFESGLRDVGESAARVMFRGL